MDAFITINMDNAAFEHPATELGRKERRGHSHEVYEKEANNGNKR